MNSRELARIRRKRKQRRKALTVAGGVFAGIFILIMIAILTPSKEQSGREWFDRQQYYIDMLTVMLDDMDTVVALYLDGDIEESDVSAHLEIFEKEIALLKYDYNKYLKNHPIKAGSYDFYTKKGVESAQECLNTYDELLSTVKECYPDKDLLAYNYLAYGQKFNRSIYMYEICKAVVYGEIGAGGEDSVNTEQTVEDNVSNGETAAENKAEKTLENDD